MSAQRHEVSYAASKLAGKGQAGKKRARAAVTKAKQSLGRRTSRRAVMRRARAAM